VVKSRRERSRETLAIFLMACKLLRDLQEVADCATHPLMREGAKGCMGARLQLKRGELNATIKDYPKGRK
jgi:hypothetical protein